LALRRWDARSGEELPLPTKRQPNLLAENIVVFPGTNRFITIAYLNNVYLWQENFQSRKLDLDPRARIADISAIALSGNEKCLVASGQTTNRVSVRDTTTWEELASWTIDCQGIRSVAISADGTLVAVTTDCGTVRLLDVATLRETKVDIGQGIKGTWGLAAAFSPDGKLLAVSYSVRPYMQGVRIYRTRTSTLELQTELIL
jgi:WD40 repeat protein